MRKMTRKNQINGSCGQGNYRVQLYSRRAALVNEFCLDTRENRVLDLEAAEDLLRETLTPCDFADLTIRLIGDEGSDNESVRQFELHSD